MARIDVTTDLKRRILVVGDLEFELQGLRVNGKTVGYYLVPIGEAAMQLAAADALIASVEKSKRKKS